MFDEDLTVKIRTKELLADLRSNRARHRQVFEEAVRRYHRKATELLQQRIDKILDGPDEPVVLAFGLSLPEDHTSDYDRIIRMMERHEDDVVTISETKYRNYVDDEWAWTKAWAASTASYVQQDA